MLTGFMGAGKSSVGRRLAYEMGVDFVDTDEIISERVEMSIDEIFDRDGEVYFRELEKAVIKEVSLGMDIVIATGGGAIVDVENFRHLKENGVFVYLRASKDVILDRLGSGDGRPLFPESGIERGNSIEELIKRREPYYRKADIIIDTNSKDIDEVVKEIKASLKE